MLTILFILAGLFASGALAFFIWAVVMLLVADPHDYAPAKSRKEGAT